MAATSYTLNAFPVAIPGLVGQLAPSASDRLQSSGSLYRPLQGPHKKSDIERTCRVIAQCAHLARHAAVVWLRAASLPLRRFLSRYQSNTARMYLASSSAEAIYCAQRNTTLCLMRTKYSEQDLHSIVFWVCCYSDPVLRHLLWCPGWQLHADGAATRFAPKLCVACITPQVVMAAFKAAARTSHL